MIFNMASFFSGIILFYIVILAALSSNDGSARLVEALASSPSPKKVIRVCQSPGCKDDGALATLACLSALAPPGVEIMKGGCTSLCGSGPVVEVCDNIDDTTSIKKKHMKGSDKILSLLDECVTSTDNDEEDIEPVLKPYMRDRLVTGYELSLEANEAYNSKNYQLAVEKYTDAIESGRKPAMIMQEAWASVASSDDTQQFSGYQWLVTSFKNSCRSRLAIKDIDGARRDAFASTVFSQNLDPDAHECLSEVCAASSDALGELQAIKAAIMQYERLEEEYSQPLPGADAPLRAETMKKKSFAAARKRELGFKVVKMENQLRG